jgi:hypothetical protein
LLKYTTDTFTWKKYSCEWWIDAGLYG